MERIIFFDGLCVLCNNFALTVFKNDKHHHFRFASLQSEKAKLLLTPQDYGLDTIIYYENGTTYYFSTAVIKIMYSLGGFYKFGALLMMLIPRFIRDFFYRKAAANRHRFAPLFPQCDFRSKAANDYTYN